MADHLFTAQPAILFMAQPANFFTAQPAILVMGCKNLLSKMGKPIFVQYFVKKCLIGATLVLMHNLNH